MTAVAAGARPAATPGIAQLAFTSLAASSIEWYDFFIYGTAAALVFPKLFFAATLPPYVAQIAAFSTFAVGFIRRNPTVAAGTRGQSSAAHSGCSSTSNAAVTLC